MSDLVGGTICNGCGQSHAFAPGIGYFCQNDACTYEKDRARDMLRRMRPIDPKDARITALETALAEAEGRVETARNAALEEAAKACEVVLGGALEALSKAQDGSIAAVAIRGNVAAARHCAQAIRDMKDRPTK